MPGEYVTDGPRPKLPRVMRGPVIMHGSTARSKQRDLDRLSAQKARSRAEIERSYTPLEIEIYRVRLCDHCQHQMAINDARTCTLAVLPVCMDGTDCPYWERRAESDAPQS